MKSVVSFFVGLIFAVGLGISGMTKTHVVRGFLDVFGTWNPNLIGVMAGAIGVHSVLYALIRKKHSPLLDTDFHVPARRDIDRRLLGGAAIFGLGWGWAGACPGPAIVAAAGGDLKACIFVLSMLVGMRIFTAVDKKLG